VFLRFPLASFGYGWLTMDRADDLPCYKKKRGAKRCFSCSSGPCSFTLAPRAASPPPSSVLKAIARIEALMKVETDPAKLEVLELVLGDLRPEVE
jgi:hypothetical protein